MKVFGRVLLFLLCTCVLSSAVAGYAEQGDVDMPHRTEEIWCENGSNRIYGVACIPEAEGRLPLVIFSHELGNNHEAGVRYAERLAAHGYAAYVFDFRGGSAGGTQNRSDGSNSEMSELTEASDLSAVLDAAKLWPFVDSDNIFLLGGSQGGLVTLITGCERQDELAGTMLMYPALSAKADSHADSYTSPEGGARGCAAVRRLDARGAELYYRSVAGGL